MNIIDNIPKSWNDITISQFLELNSIDLTQFESEFYLNLEKLAIVTNTSSDDECWEEMDVIELSNIVKNAEFLYSAPPNKFKQKLDNGFVLKSFNQLTLGEFIDIEYFISNDLLGNFTKLLAIFYRKCKTGEWGERIIEPYNVIELDLRKDEFDDLPITYVFGIIDSYIQFKNDFITKYEPLFEPNFDEETEESFEDFENDPIVQYELEQEKKLEEKQKKWVWERLLFDLSNGDLIKLNQITELGLIYVFNILSMKKELGVTS